MTTSPVRRRPAGWPASCIGIGRHADARRVLGRRALAPTRIRPTRWRRSRTCTTRTGDGAAMLDAAVRARSRAGPAHPWAHRLHAIALLGAGDAQPRPMR
jgi:hypothetical protein